VARLNLPAHSSSGLGHRPLTAAARVRIPYAPFCCASLRGTGLVTWVRCVRDARNGSCGVPPVCPPKDLAMPGNRLRLRVQRRTGRLEVRLERFVTAVARWCDPGDIAAGHPRHVVRTLIAEEIAAGRVEQHDGQVRLRDGCTRQGDGCGDPVARWPAYRWGAVTELRELEWHRHSDRGSELARRTRGVTRPAVLVGDCDGWLAMGSGRARGGLG
jgi:hypothetical protein